jgi:predicted nucleic acid-binding protein
LVKLIQSESESDALRRYLEGGPGLLVTSALSKVELVRAVTRGGQSAVAQARLVLSRMTVLALSDDVLETAAALYPGTLLRTLDALHLASALIVAPLRAVVTYDQRMLEHAVALGMPVESPR